MDLEPHQVIIKSPAVVQGVHLHLGTPPCTPQSVILKHSLVIQFSGSYFGLHDMKSYKLHSFTSWPGRAACKKKYSKYSTFTAFLKRAINFFFVRS